MKTMICLILDRSGSMQGREDDVVGGVNSFIEEQKKIPDPASVAFVRFDSVATERFRPMQNLSEVQPLTRADYKPRGGTPLLDAVGKTIVALDDDWKKEQPERCIVMIVTDGQENESHEYTKEKVKALIQARQDSEKWAFIYLGANVDSFEEASSMGINLQNTANYHSTTKGTRALYAASAESVGRMRTSGSTVAHNLGGDIEEDGGLTKQSQQTPPPVTTKSTPWVAPKQSDAWTPPA